MSRKTRKTVPVTGPAGEYIVGISRHPGIGDLIKKHGAEKVRRAIQREAERIMRESRRVKKPKLFDLTAKEINKHAERTQQRLDSLRMVNHPPHYVGDDPTYEHFKVCLAWGLDRNAFLYNATKYICRVGKKSDKVVEDLRKAAWYLAKAIEQAEDEEFPGVG